MTTSWKMRAKQLEERLIAWRRDFHRHPELGFEETRTTEVILKELAAAGVDELRRIEPTGVLATIHGEKPGPLGFLRVDIDALPIQEETGTAYASAHPGRMHACGHDGHIAVGLGVASLLQEYRADVEGDVRILFQPAEEGLGGAARCIEAGVLVEPVPSFALGLHLWNTYPAGWMGITSGAVMAGSDRIEIELHGAGGHGAAPHLAKDVVLAGAYVLTALQTIIPRNIDPLEQAVLSLTTFHAGDADNVIPQKARLEGTLRTMNLDVRAAILTRMEEIIQHQAKAFSCEAAVTITPLTAPLVNAPEITEVVLSRAEALFPDGIVSRDERVMASEDMAEYLQRVPGCYFFIGSADPGRGLDYAHHHPKFDFDERVLVDAAALMTDCACSLLRVLHD